MFETVNPDDDFTADLSLPDTGREVQLFSLLSARTHTDSQATASWPKSGTEEFMGVQTISSCVT